MKTKYFSKKIAIVLALLVMFSSLPSVPVSADTNPLTVSKVHISSGLNQVSPLFDGSKITTFLCVCSEPRKIDIERKSLQL